MELGQRIRDARLEAGLSQKQLSDGVVTRNMLSLIEHGSARPSMDTLQDFARRLGKSVSYFLEEDSVTSPNTQTMTAARIAFGKGQYEDSVRILEDFQSPDPVFEEEYTFLLAVTQMMLGKKAFEKDQIPYAKELLNQAGKCKSIYWSAPMERERLLLLGQADSEEAEKLPSDDRELLLRAENALKKKNPKQAAAYLEAAQDQDNPRWHYLRGECFFVCQQWDEAIRHYLPVENQFAPVLFRLEQCYREMDNYKMAYLYACRQRK